MNASKAKILMGLASFGALAQAALPGCDVRETDTESAEVGEGQQAAVTDTCRCYCTTSSISPYPHDVSSAPKTVDPYWDFPKASSCPPSGDGVCKGYEYNTNKSLTGKLVDCGWVKS